jgi:nitrate/nitrite transport system substrate-binding protein
MSDLEYPNEAGFPHHHKGCICGRHRNEHEHDYEARLQQHVLETCETRRYDGVVAAAVMRKVFPEK